MVYSLRRATQKDKVTQYQNNYDSLCSYENNKGIRLKIYTFKVKNIKIFLLQHFIHLLLIPVVLILNVHF